MYVIVRIFALVIAVIVAKVLGLMEAKFGGAPGGHAVFHDGRWYNVYCFAKAPDADAFMGRFGGEKLDPQQRGKGSNWAKWNKP